MTIIGCTWWFQTLQSFGVAYGLEIVDQVTGGAAPLPHQPQERAAWATLRLQHFQRAHLHVV